MCGRVFARFVWQTLTVLCRMGTTFPESQVPTLGMFYNGRTSRVDVAISNKEKLPMTVNYIGGQFQDLTTFKPVVNVLNPPTPQIAAPLKSPLPPDPTSPPFTSAGTSAWVFACANVSVVNRKTIQLNRRPRRKRNLPLQCPNLLPWPPRPSSQYRSTIYDGRPNFSVDCA